AEAHVLALEHLLRGRDSRSINLGTGHGASVSEVIEVARRVTSRPIPVHHAARRNGDPARLVADPARAKEELYWTARRSDLETILSDAWQWHQKRFRSQL